MVKLAKKNGLKPGPNRTFVHDDPLRTGRFELIGRPPAFVFGFSGIKYSYRQLQENIELWISNRQNAGIKTPMKALPAVIATQGCFAWRNAAPLALSNRQMLGIGNDDAPVRLIALQLLYLLNRRLNVTSDGYGLKPSLNAYLSHFEAPKFELGVGDVNDEVNAIAAADDDTSPGTRAARDTARFEPARDRATIEQAAAKAMVETAAASKPKPAPAAASPAPAPAAAEKAPETPAEPAVFDKPSPFASAPIPPADKPVKTDPPAEAAVFDKPSPFASAPTLSAEEPTPPEPARSPAPVAPLGSAPIPGTQDSTATMPVPEIPAPAAPLGSAPIPPSEPPKPAASAPAAAKVIPPKPPVDIDLGFGDASTEDKPESEDDDFIETVVIPPNAGAMNDDKSRNSTDAFIARVKEQLSTSEPPAGNEKDFTSTIPQ
jgi:hypothetical protein